MPVNIYNLNELKHTTDDQISKALASLDYVQDHRLMDVRLLFGYIGVIAAALAGGWDYKVGFEKAKVYTLLGVMIYFIFYGAMNFWQYFVERGIVYEGVKGTRKVRISSSTSRTAPQYTLKLVLLDNGTQVAEKEAHELFTKWFDCDGNIVGEPLQTWLALKVKELELDIEKKTR